MGSSQVELEDGEVLCNRCKGEKQWKVGTVGETIILEVCRKCKGIGKIDWVENICGEESNGRRIILSTEKNN